jgi:hypothetical protein
MMAQSLDASVSSLMIYRLVRKSFCCCRCMMLYLLYCTEFFRLEQLPNLVVQFCPCLKNFYYVHSTFCFFMVFCLLDSQFWRRLSTNTLSSQSEFPLYFTLSLNWLCSVFIGLLPPLNCKFQGDMHCLPITQARLNSSTHWWRTSVTCLLLSLQCCRVSASPVALFGRSAIFSYSRGVLH